VQSAKSDSLHELVSFGLAMFAKLALGAKAHAADVAVEIFNFQILRFTELLLSGLVDGDGQVQRRVFLFSRFALAHLLIPNGTTA